MVKKIVLSVLALSVIAVVFMYAPAYGRRLNLQRFRGPALIEYNDYLARHEFVSNAVRAGAGIDDPIGTIYVADILKYKGKRRFPLKARNDAEQLLIQAIDKTLDKEYTVALIMAKDALRKDGTYNRARFLLAGLYEQSGDLKNMERQYRHYLNKTLFMRKVMEEETGLGDPDFKFIKAKFDKYGLHLSDSSLAAFRARHWMVGAVCLAIVVIFLAFFIKMRDIWIRPSGGNRAV